MAFFGMTLPPLAMQNLSIADYIVLAAYIVATVILGSWMGRGSDESLGSYFLAERTTNWILACISILATDLSAISYMGVPGWVYQKDLKYALGSLLFPPVMLVIVLIFVPIYFRMKVFTVYEYLEQRFHPLARTVTAVLFLFLRGVHLACAIYIPAIAFKTFFGVPEIWCIVVIGILTTFYTLLGGMKAVIWTDFLQFIVMFGGLFLMIGLLLQGFGWDVVGTWKAASQIVSPVTGTPHTTLVSWSFDPKTESTVWGLIAFYIVYNIGVYGADQVVVQRYFTMASRRDIVKSVLSSGLLNVMSMFSLAYAGLLMTVYFTQHPEIAARIKKPDEILPTYVIHVLPTGVRGLIFAALLAATMSVLSAGLNSFSTVTVMDLYRRYGPGRRATEQQCLKVAKWSTIFFGALLTGLALWLSKHTGSILELFNRLSSIFIGPITGIFLLGVLTKRGNLAGVLVGAPAGLFLAYQLTWSAPLVENVNWMWTAPLSCLATLIVGYVTSILIRTEQRTQVVARDAHALERASE
jgi:SSS family transporter